jgi:hypothetical protein
MACSRGRDQPGAGHFGSTTGYERVHIQRHRLSHSLMVRFIIKAFHKPML